ncbi:MerR family transcriptional regulator [Sporolactobacillus shoreicorticis]|uniref:MerR family transcriptional regulator n=1 Tax=Sporolactobacillus shoreicorticis TaxID=1923877 RepID=A0ABW5S7M2_9BACL|nr:MerR family transcriptional regulator [Sporolactobacillus shoreicorticis]MCO7128271.1 MerR family transcriptional regulator [Sporolactobacillus shoreicorticis]
MAYFTAKQIADQLTSEGTKINLRTVRYYTQIEIIPPLVTVGKKRVYTDLHLDYLRAILTLSHAGETLAAIRDKLDKCSRTEIRKIGNQMNLYLAENILNRETTKINEDVFVTLNTEIAASTKQKIVDAVSQIMKEDAKNEH